MLDERSPSRQPWLAAAALIALALGGALASVLLMAAPLDRAVSYTGFLPPAQSPSADAHWARDYATIEIRDNRWRPLRLHLELRASPEAPQGAAVTFLVDDRPLRQGHASAEWVPYDVTIDAPSSDTGRSQTRSPYVSVRIQSAALGASGASVGLRAARASPVIRSVAGARSAAVGAFAGAAVWLLLPIGATVRRRMASGLDRMARPIVAVPGLALCLGLGVLLIADDVQWRPAFAPIDLPSFFWAARVTFVEGQSPYTSEALARGAQRLGQHVFPFLSPPPTLLLVAPLAGMSFDTAAVLLVRLNGALFIAGLILIFRRLLRVPLNTPVALAMLVYALSFWPVHNTIAHGQLNLIVMLCLVIAWGGTRGPAGAADPGRKPAAAFGAALALALAIGYKTYPALVLPYLAIARRTRTLAWTIALLVVLVTIAAIVLPAAAWADWFAHVAPTLGYGLAPWQLFEAASVYNQSLNGIVARVFGPSVAVDVPWPWPGAASVAMYALAAAAIAWHFHVCARASGRLASTSVPSAAEDCQWAATLFLMFLLAPFSWDHHLVMVLPACLFVLQHAWGAPLETPATSSLPLWSRVVASVALILIAWPLASESTAYREGWRTLMISAKGFCVLALWGLALSWLRQVGGSPAQGG